LKQLTNYILHLERKFVSPTETFIYNQIEDIQRCGFKNTIVGTVKEIKGIEHNFKMVLPDKSFFLNTHVLFPSVSNSLFKKINDKKINILHTHYLTDASFFYPLTKKLCCPKICSVYGYDVSEFPQKFWGLGKYYLKRVFKSYDKILAMNPDMKEDLLKIGCPEEKIVVHYYGTDISRYTSINRDYDFKNGILRLLTVASLREKKGHAIVLKALALIKNKIKFEYDIVGDGPLKHRLVSLANELGINKHVKFHGHIDYKSNVSFYEKADVFILPSQRSASGDKEGIPGVIVEGMASGLPVISTYHAGIPYIIKDGFSGFLASEGNSKKVADYIERLYFQKEIRETVGQNARKVTLKDLNLNIRTLELIKIYESLI
jgi:colanic acid/amylovoran biosynthesis glycosyltransferase